MGQNTYALMFGVEDGPEVDWAGEEIIGEWGKVCADKIKAWEKRHPHKSWRDPYGRDVYVPATTYEADPPLVGFYIAVGASGKAGIPNLEGCAIGDVKAHYADAYKAARRRWRRFAKWATAKGIALPKARIFLTEAEIVERLLAAWLEAPSLRLGQLLWNAHHRLPDPKPDLFYVEDETLAAECERFTGAKR